MTGWKTFRKVILNHNVPTVCACGYRSHPDALLRCVGEGEYDQIYDISHEPDINVRYSGDETLFHGVHNTNAAGQAIS